jgi:phosphatidylserine decarboxylase
VGEHPFRSPDENENLTRTNGEFGPVSHVNKHHPSVFSKNYRVAYLPGMVVSSFFLFLNPQIA